MASLFSFMASLFLASFFPFLVAYAHNCSDLYLKAAENVSDKTFIAIDDWIASNPSIGDQYPFDVAVWAVQNDRNDMVRDILIERLCKCAHVRLRASIKTKEFEKYKDYVADMVKWKFLFDPDTPSDLQQLQKARYMIDAKVAKFREQCPKAEMVLVTTITDYRTGDIVVKKTAIASVTSFSKTDWAWRLAVAPLFSLGFAVSLIKYNKWTPRFWRYWLANALFSAGLFWILVGRHL